MFARLKKNRFESFKSETINSHLVARARAFYMVLVYTVENFSYSYARLSRLVNVVATIGAGSMKAAEISYSDFNVGENSILLSCRTAIMWL